MILKKYISTRYRIFIRTSWSNTSNVYVSTIYYDQLKFFKYKLKKLTYTNIYLLGAKRDVTCDFEWGNNLYALIIGKSFWNFEKNFDELNYIYKSIYWS